MLYQHVMFVCQYVCQYMILKWLLVNNLWRFLLVFLCKYIIFIQERNFLSVVCKPICWEPVLEIVYLAEAASINNHHSFFFWQKLLLHLNQVSSSHPKERFELYHKLQGLFDKWIFHLRWAGQAWVVSITAKIAFTFIPQKAVYILLYDYYIFTVIDSSLYEFITIPKNDQLPVSLLAQLVEHCTSITEVMG